MSGPLAVFAGKAIVGYAISKFVTKKSGNSKLGMAAGLAAGAFLNPVGALAGTASLVGPASLGLTGAGAGASAVTPAVGGGLMSNPYAMMAASNVVSGAIQGYEGRRAAEKALEAEREGRAWGAEQEQKAYDRRHQPFTPRGAPPSRAAAGGLLSNPQVYAPNAVTEYEQAHRQVAGGVR